MRIDKYLKVAGIIKRRTISNEICDNNKVSVNNNTVKAHYEVKVGDKIHVQYGNRELVHVVEEIPYESKRKKEKNLY